MDWMVLKSICREAGRLILSCRQSQNLDVRYKADQTMVTAADKAAHDHITDQLQRHWPDIPLISEEGTPLPLDKRSQWPMNWCIDPLDGTQGFALGSDQFTVNIALIDQHQSRLGIIYVPSTDTFYYGEVGQGAWSCEGENKAKPIQAKPISWNAAKVLLGSLDQASCVGACQLAFPNWQFEAIHSSVKLAYLASGMSDFYIRLGPINEWDVAAGDAILTAAGGSMVDFHGQALQYNCRASFFIHPLLAHGISEDPRRLASFIKQIGEY